MSAEKLPVVVNGSPQLISVGINVDKDDVAAILMAKAEKLIKGHITVCANTEKKLQATAQELGQELREQLDKAAAACADKTLKLLEQAAEELACKNVNSAVACVNTDPVKGTLTYQLVVSGCKPQINWMVSSQAKVPAEVKASWKTIKENQKEISANSHTWLDWRRKLQDLPSMERRAKAAVAEQRLSQSVEGQELLTMLESKMDGGIDLLGIS